MNLQLSTLKWNAVATILKKKNRVKLCRLVLTELYIKIMKQTSLQFSLNELWLSLFMENCFTNASKNSSKKSEINCCCTSLNSVPSAVGKGAWYLHISAALAMKEDINWLHPELVWLRRWEKYLPLQESNPGLPAHRLLSLYWMSYPLPQSTVIKSRIVL
jgi:hypothetical protein